MKTLFNKFKKIIMLTLIIFSSSLAAADVSGKMIAYGCFSCHTEKSFNLKLPVPELTQALIAFKYNKKQATIMDRIAKGYTNAELKAVATYLGNLK